MSRGLGDVYKRQIQDKKEGKKKLTAGQKAGIGTGILALGGIITAVVFCKGKTLKPANFAEHIDFKPAQTMEEAIEFAKKNFGVKKFDLADDVELANWVNEGLVNINNRFKGKAQMPENIIWDKKVFEKVSKGVDGFVPAYHQPLNSTLGINKNYFDTAKSQFKELIDLNLQAAKKSSETNKVTAETLVSRLFTREISPQGRFNLLPFLDKDLQARFMGFLYKYKTTPETFTRFDAVSAFQTYDDLLGASQKIFKSPLDTIKDLLKNEKFTKNLAEKGIPVKSIDEYSQLSKKEQILSCIKLINASELEHPVKGTYRGNSKFDFIYHEMGHLLHEMNTSNKDWFWGRLSSKSEKAFKSDANKQKIAGQISWYAQTAPAEFVAECFNALCAGRKLPDDVMKMYEYYKGPMLPNA